MSNDKKDKSWKELAADTGSLEAMGTSVDELAAAFRVPKELLLPKEPLHLDILMKLKHDMNLKPAFVIYQDESLNRGLVHELTNMVQKWAITHVVTEDNQVLPIRPISVDIVPTPRDQDLTKNVVTISIGYEIDRQEEGS